MLSEETVTIYNEITGGGGINGLNDASCSLPARTHLAKDTLKKTSI